MTNINIERYDYIATVAALKDVFESKVSDTIIGVSFLESKKLLLAVEMLKNQIGLFEITPDLSELSALFEWLESCKNRMAVYDLKGFYRQLSAEGKILRFAQDDRVGVQDVKGVTSVGANFNSPSSAGGRLIDPNFPKNSLCIMLSGFVQNSSLPFDLLAQAERNLEPQVLADLIEEFNDEHRKLNTQEREAIVSLFLAKRYFQLFDQKLLDLWQNIESPVAVILGQMELGGVYIDRDKLKIVSDELQTGSIQLQTEVLDLLEAPTLNLNSPSQLGVVLVERGFKLKKTASGKISTDREVLEGWEATDETGVIAKILEYRTLSKLFSTYTDSFLKLLDENSRIHGTYNQVQAATGRLSSNNPNLQNIPIRNPKYGPLIRSTFSAPENRVIIAADYSQMELRLLAHFCQDPVLIDAFAQNQDIHARTSSEIFEVEIDQVTKEQRRLGKTLNFALLYQQGPQATAKQLGIKNKEASAYIEKYFNRFAKVKPFIEETIENARKNGCIETYFGRRRYFENLNSGNDFLRKIDERAAFNAVLQGSNADIIKLAMINLETRLKAEKLDGFMVLQVHDELVLEVAQNQAEEIKKVLIEEMEVKQPLKVPILVEAGIGKNWAEAK
jgi:DNA polymerase-1